MESLPPAKIRRACIVYLSEGRALGGVDEYEVAKWTVGSEEVEEFETILTARWKPPTHCFCKALKRRPVTCSDYPAHCLPAESTRKPISAAVLLCLLCSSFRVFFSADEDLLCACAHHHQGFVFADDRFCNWIVKNIRCGWRFWSF